MVDEPLGVFRIPFPSSHVPKLISHGLYHFHFPLQFGILPSPQVASDHDLLVKLRDLHLQMSILHSQALYLILDLLDLIREILGRDLLCLELSLKVS